MARHKTEPSAAADSSFAGLPLADQIEYLRRELKPGREEELLKKCAALADSDPLAWLCRAVVERGLLSNPNARARMAGLLIETPDTGIRKVLRSLTVEGAPLAAPRRAEVGLLLREVLERIPFNRLTAMCLVDRTCKQMFSEDRQAWLEHLEEQVRQCIIARNINDISHDKLVQIPAVVLERLRKTALETGKEVAAAFAALCRDMTVKAAALLESLPKAVSQANAEELLSRRVYADPGHFLIELLQNAEDAGAVRWRVVFDQHRIVVFHDGIPFDIRDLVGVTSIGQTTKGKEQIGFFGVGFKAVYEVTDRPQIFSGDLCFEIADISIPRLLSQRPTDVPQEGTVVVLPYRVGLDEKRSPKALYERAIQIDPCVLITLRRMEHIEFELTAAAGGPARRAYHERLVRGERCFQSTLSLEPDNETSAYLVSDLEYDFAGVREAGKSSRTGVMVGVRVDSQGNPVPLPRDASTVYSFLPTSEISGLRFFVQGHFDLLVDRERISKSSEWNRRLYDTVPDGLRVLAERILAADDAPGLSRSTRAGMGLLDILPLEDELPDAFYRSILPRLSEMFREIPCVPGAEGYLVSPSRLLIVDPGLAAFLGNRPVPLRGESGRASGNRFYAQSPELSDRQCLAAVSLGASFFGVSELLQMLADACADTGELREAYASLPFMQNPTPEQVLRLYGVLTAAIEREKDGVEGAAGRKLLRRYADLPLLFDVEGLWRKVPDEGYQKPARGNRRYRELFKDLMPFVHPDTDTMMQSVFDGQSPRQRADMLFDWLRLPRLNEEWLLDFLESALVRKQPAAAELAMRVLNDPARLKVLLEIFVDCSPMLQKRAAALPVFPRQGGGFAAAANDLGSPESVIRYEQGANGKRMIDLYAGCRALADLEHPLYGSVLGRFLEAVVTPQLGIDSLIHDVKMQVLRLDEERVRRLHELLAEMVSELRAPVIRELSHMIIWPDSAGRLGCLSGPEQVYIPNDPDIPILFPDTRFLLWSLQNHPLLEQIKVRRFGTAAVCQAFSPDSPDEFRLEPTPSNVARVQAYLISHADEVRLQKPERLLRQPLFRSQSGEYQPADALRLPTDAAVLEFVRHIPRAKVLDIEDRGFEILKLFGLEKQVAPYLIEHLIQDVLALWQSSRKREDWTRSFPPLGNLDGIRRFLRLIMASYRSVPQALMNRLLGLPIFPDEKGECGMLRDQSGWHPRAVFPCIAERRPLFRPLELRLLDEEIQNIAWPVLQNVTGWANLDVLIRHPELQKSYSGSGERRPHQQEAYLKMVQQYLVEHRTDVLKEFPPVTRKNQAPANDFVNAFCIWPTRSGQILPAREIFEGETLDLLIDHGSPEEAWCQERMLIDEAQPAFRALKPALAPADVGEVIERLVVEFAVPDRVLAKQNPFLSTVQRVAIVFQYLNDRYETDEKRRDTLPMVDVAGRLVFRALFTADDSTIALLRGLGAEGEIMDPAFRAALPRSVFRQDRFPAYPVSEVIRLAALRPFPSKRERDSLSEYSDDVAEFAEMRAGETGEDRNIRRFSVGVVPAVDEGFRREFFDWLLENEHEVFPDLDACALLARAEIFPTRTGTLVAPTHLVIESPVEHLPVECFPHPSIPERLLKLLVLRLGVGKPPVSELLLKHVLPAYRQAVNAGDRESAGRLFAGFAQALEGRPLSYLDDLKQADASLRNILLENAQGFFTPAAELIWPPDELEAAVANVFGEEFQRPSSIRYPAEIRLVLLRLGVMEIPDEKRLRRVLETPPRSLEAALGLTAILAWHWRSGNRYIAENLPLRKQAWLIDAEGGLRRPGDLFLRSAGVEVLIGSRLSLFCDARAEALLGPDFCAELGIRGLTAVGLVDVARNLLEHAEAARPISRVVYEWLERGLREETIDPVALQGVLAGQSFILTDDGRYWPAHQTVGFRGFAWFGNRRGYWESGVREFPLLCRSFRIPTEPDVATIEQFLKELHEAVVAYGDEVLLRNDSGLIHLLMHNYATLTSYSRRLDRSWRVCLCREVGPDVPADPPVMRLVHLDESALYLSDTPSLEQEFARTGRFRVVVRASGSEQEKVDAFYLTQGIQRIRDAYRVVPETEKVTDRTGDFQRQILSIRGLIRSLAAIVPRIRLGRPGLLAGGWQDSRLQLLGTSGAIRAIDRLRVRMMLPAVGEVLSSAPAVYDAEEGRLLLDTQLLERPEDYGGELASGLLPCLYQGPGEEGLRDLLEILLPLRTEEAMYAYLDRRNFPVAARLQGPLERLGERLGQILDFGWPARFQSRFPEIGTPAWERWRHAGFVRRLSQVASLPEHADEYGSWIKVLMPEILAEIELKNACEPFRDLLFETLKAESLSDVPLELFHEIPGRTETDEKGNDDEDLDQVLPGAKRLLGKSELREEDGANGSITFPVIETSSWQPSNSADPETGLFGRVMRWLFGAAPIRAHESAFTPRLTIPAPEMHTSAQAMAIESTPPSEWVTWAPATLPYPWQFGVHTLAGLFSPESQAWSCQDYELVLASRTGTEGDARGQVRFQVRLSSGDNLLPMPLYSRLASVPMILHGEGDLRVAGVMETGGILIFIQSGKPVTVEYTAELLPPPLLTGDNPSFGRMEELLERTTSRDSLPRSLLEAVEAPEFRTGPVWLRASRVADLVRARYIHHGLPIELPNVAVARNRLKPGRGHHLLSLLHAGADARFLGCGSVAALNLLVVEVLRHLGIPALPATGYRFRDNWLPGPQQIFAVALVGALGGVALLPLDVSDMQSLRPTPVAPRPPELPRPTAPIGVIFPPEAAWQVLQSGAKDVNADGEGSTASEEGRTPAVDLVTHAVLPPQADATAEKVIAYLRPALRTMARQCSVKPELLDSFKPEMKTAAPEDRIRLMQKDLGVLLQNPQLAEAFVNLLRRGSEAAPELAETWRELRKLGLVRVEKLSMFVVEPKAVGGDREQEGKS